MLFAAQVGDLFAGGRSSHEGYTETFAAQFATLSRVELPVAKNTQKIFQNFSFKCSGGWSWRLARDLIQSPKSRVLHKMGQFLNLFNFPSNFHDCSLFSPFQTSLKLIVSLSKNLHFYIISTSFFKKMYGFSYYLIAFHVYSMCFLDLCVVV